MRLRTSLFIFFALIVALEVALLLLPEPPKAGRTASAPVPAPMTAAPPVAPAPPAATPAPDAAQANSSPTDAPTITEQAAVEQTAPSATPAGQDALPPLTEVKVTPHLVHPIPEDTAPPPPAPGHPPSLPAMGQSEEVRLGPHAAPVQTAQSAFVPRQFSGAATATGGVELRVDSTPVALFGIKAAGGGDRCGAGSGSDCLEAAKRALSDRIGAAGHVSCRIPNPQHPGATAFAICLDPNGVDLSGFLIAQGLALADTGQSYDYVGAESVARNLKHGLWQFR
jgi:endonuclease YncB( thermonuclease family)